MGGFHFLPLPSETDVWIEEKVSCSFIGLSSNQVEFPTNLTDWKT